MGAGNELLELAPALTALSFGSMSSALHIRMQGIVCAGPPSRLCQKLRMVRDSWLLLVKALYTSIRYGPMLRTHHQDNLPENLLAPHNIAVDRGRTQRIVRQ